MEQQHECRVCHQTLAESEFFKASKPGFIDKICKACKHEAQQHRRKEFKRWSVAHKGGKCLVCGYNNCNASLDFHHLDPAQKEFDFGSKLFGVEKAKKELDKCVLLCRNCHSEVHAGYIDNENVKKLETDRLAKLV